MVEDQAAFRNPSPEIVVPQEKEEINARRGWPHLRGELGFYLLFPVISEFAHRSPLCHLPNSRMYFPLTRVGVELGDGGVVVDEDVIQQIGRDAVTCVIREKDLPSVHGPTVEHAPGKVSASRPYLRRDSTA